MDGCWEVSDSEFMYGDYRLIRGRTSAAPTSQCNSIEHGYNCSPEISHYWGQYSPYFSVPSNISQAVPKHCKVTFVNILARHGARDPTASKTKTYSQLVSNITTNVKSFTGKYAFLDGYNYTLGADQLTTFGQQQMVDSGIKFYERYIKLAEKVTPFVRSSGEARVVESAMNFTQGYHQAFLQVESHGKDAYPYHIEVISEDTGSNNTLSHDLCTAFEDGPDSEIGGDAQAKWVAVFAPAILKRLNTDLPGANLSKSDVISFMDLCPFETVASPTGAISPFCDLFTEDEWKQYDYYETLGKYYGCGPGNPLGPTNGVGFTNELIARMTNTAVVDHTSTNSTLDDDPLTFPTDTAHTLFADFSHDNDMTGILAAIGVYNATVPPSNNTIETTAQTGGYSASWTVPFGARVYFEKLNCGNGEEKVRVVVNDRVVPLPSCGSDEFGMCTLSKFVASLSFARGGGHWDQCFV